MSLWQHEETGRMTWNDYNPGPRWYKVPTINEDELSPKITDEEYSRWFDMSIIPGGVGCRIGPKI